MAYVDGLFSGRVLCEALGIDPSKIQGFRIECTVGKPMRVVINSLAYPLDLDRLEVALRKIRRQDLQIIEEKTMNEIDRYWNQIPEHVREAIVKRIVADWLKHESPSLSVESASAPVPPAAIAGHDEDDAA